MGLELPQNKEKETEISELEQRLENLASIAKKLIDKYKQDKNDVGWQESDPTGEFQTQIDDLFVRMHETKNKLKDLGYYSE